MNQIYYCASDGGFYFSEDKERYQSSENGWPDTIVAISEGEYQHLIEGMKQGLIIVADESGIPQLADMQEKEMTHGELIAQAEEIRAQLMSEANQKIAPLQAALDVGIATEDELAQLKAWKTYLVLLSRMDTSNAPDIELPEVPDVA